MTEKIFNLKVLVPFRNLEIFVENDGDISSTLPLTQERVRAVGRSFTRTGIAMATNALYYYAISQATNYLF